MSQIPLHGRAFDRGLVAALSFLLLVVACGELLAPVVTQRAGTSASLLNPPGHTVVHAADMKGWVFFNDQNGSACSGSNCQLVNGPTGPPSGSGSAEIAVGATNEGKALVLADYKGVKFDRVTALSYWTYRQTTDTGNNLAIALQFNVDYDLDDTSTPYQGRIVFEPYMGVGGNVPEDTWQQWDARAGRWWGTRATVTVNNTPVSNGCRQASPCTWSQLLASFPDLGLHSTYGAVVLKAGSGWATFRGNIDQLTIEVDSVETTFDFDLDAPAGVPESAPDSLPVSWISAERVNWTPDALARPLFSELVVLQFHDGTTQSEKAAAVASVGAEVVGGYPSSVGEGFYVLRVPDDSTGSAVRDAVVTLNARRSVGIVGPNHLRRDLPTYRRPNEGPGKRPSDWRLDTTSAFGAGGGNLWAASAIRAPYAWGCASGAGVRVGVLDFGLHVNSELVGRVLPASVTYPAQGSAEGVHGQLVASVLGATADNQQGTAGIAHGSDLLLLDPATYVNGQITFDGLGFVLVGDGVIWSHLQRIRTQGVRILNISLGTDRVTAPNAALLASEATFISHAIAALTYYGTVPPPLIVLSAGNAGPTARPEWGSYGIFAESLATTTIVVSAASRMMNVPQSDATGSGLIDMWAPGEDVAAFRSVTGDVLVDGSSFAAPLVAGTAALMLQQDTTLTAEELKQFIIGSASAARGINGKPFLDAYAALKRVARRPGTPLCGNRLWSAGGGTLHAQRDSSGPAEALITLTGDPFELAYINAHHGGRRIETQFSNRFVLTSGVWTPGTWSPDLEREYSGAFKGSGAYLQDHDDSVSTQVDAQLIGSTVNFSLHISHLRGGLPQRTVSAQEQISLTKALTELCVREELDTLGVYQCIATDSAGTVDLLSGLSPAGSSPNHLHALDPQGRFVVVAIVTLRRVTTFETSFGACSDSPASFPQTRCRELESISVNSLRSQLVRVELATGASFVINASAALADGALGDEVWWLAITEDGSELVIQVGNLNGAGQGICTNGRHDWLTIPSSTGVASTVAFRRVVPGTALCEGSVDGTGTSASIKVGPP